LSEIAAIVDRHLGQRGDLIAILEDIQSRYAYLPEESLREVSERTGRSLVDIYGLATFYKLFSLEPRGKHLVTCCLGTACHVRGAQGVVEALERRLAITAVQTTPDKEFSLETVNCLGACALGPVVVIDGRYHSKVSSTSASRLVDRAAKGDGAADGGADDGLFTLNLSCPHCGRRLQDEHHTLDGCPAIRLDATVGSQRSWVRLSSLYGSQVVATELEIPGSSVVEFQCPHCHAQLPSLSDCWECGAPMVALQVVGGGTMSFCSRRGCPQHLLDITQIQPTRPLVSEE